MKRALACAALVVAVLALAACGRENRETRVYGPNAYAIAGDTTPWSSPAFKGDELAWNHQEEKRARLQNEYLRIR